MPEVIEQWLDDRDRKRGDDLTDISLCEGCFCMTHTIDGRCGKCGAVKVGRSQSQLVEDVKPDDSSLNIDSRVWYPSIARIGKNYRQAVIQHDADGEIYAVQDVMAEVQALVASEKAAIARQIASELERLELENPNNWSTHYQNGFELAKDAALAAVRKGLEGKR